MDQVRYPPGPKSRYPGSLLFEMRRDPLNFLSGLAQNYGDLVHFKIGRQDAFLLNHPDYIRDVLLVNSKNFIKGETLEKAKRLLGEGLLTSEGEFHHRQRRLAQPAFHHQRIATYANIMTEYSVRMRERWKDGATLDISQEMMRLTLSIVAKALFDADVESEADEIYQALTVSLKAFMAFTSPFAGLFEKLPWLPVTRRFKKARERLDATIYRVLHERRASGVDRGDLLSMLLLAQDEEGGSGSMTDEQVRDELITIFLAGHETTANALTWTWHLLAQHPAVEAAVHAEVEGLGDRLPDYTDLPRLRYTEMVFTEAMRLYPPAWMISRRTQQEYTVGGYKVPAGSVLIMSQYVMHRNPLYFPEPLRFDPQRWTQEAKNSRPKFSYFPFSGGQRGCIGEGFAWMEGILIMATLSQQWRMLHVSSHPVELQPLISLRPKNGVWITLKQW
jgi:cytochrome P450